MSNDMKAILHTFSGFILLGMGGAFIYNLLEPYGFWPALGGFLLMLKDYAAAEWASTTWEGLLFIFGGLAIYFLWVGTRDE